MLLIAYHFPPCAMSSGVQRTLGFSTHLRKSGWDSVVLTANAAAYERTSSHQLDDISSDVIVSRSLALDVARQLAIRGRYWSRLALPDRWSSWWFSAVPRALSLIRQHSIDAIWSTYPIATAHAIAFTVAKITRLPWIADFRDPMVERIGSTGEWFPKDAALRRARLNVERKVIRSASHVVFCTEGARTIVADRYQDVRIPGLSVIGNGFEEGTFQKAEALAGINRGSPKRVLLHSGIIYPGTDRDPAAVFAALRVLARKGVISKDTFELRLRDPSNQDLLRNLAIEHDVSDLVTILPALPYTEALAEMMTADGLLLLQGYTSNPAVPAKLYEYLRAGKPIVALVHPEGDTAALLRHLGIRSVAPLTDPVAAERLIVHWISNGPALLGELPSKTVVADYSRERMSLKLAQILDGTGSGEAFGRSGTR